MEEKTTDMRSSANSSVASVKDGSEACCTKCQSPFKITDSDQAFYHKMEVPPPTYCPICRVQRRLLLNNETNLYHSKCDLCHKTMLSTYDHAPFPVYCQPCWWSDNWNPMVETRDFNFKRSFFEQLKELSDKIPRQNLTNAYLQMENSEFNNMAGHLKNCYLNFNADFNEDCYYVNSTLRSKNSIDCYQSNSLELCYENFMSTRDYNSDYIFHSENCTDSLFLYNCSQCKNCFGCVNLKQKQHCINNKQLSEEEYFSQLEQLKANLNTYEDYQTTYRRFLEFAQTFPKKHIESVHSENVSGNYIYNSKNAQECYIIDNCEDLKYCQEISLGAKDCMDYSVWGNKAELIYESCTVGENIMNIKFCYDCWPNSSDMEYCLSCNSNSNLFGCVGLKKKQYCILNKQYTKEEYFELKAKIIKHMKNTPYQHLPPDKGETGEFALANHQRGSGVVEYGEFFPSWMSPYHYNETKAYNYFPLTKEEALSQGYTWKDDPPPFQRDLKMISPRSVPLINEVTDEILQQVLECTECHSPYKIIQQELKFYRQKQLPIPSNCYFCRYKQMIKQRTPLKNYDRNCMKCKIPVRSPYSGNDPDIIYCEPCIQNELHA